jgi:hypothetical protein
LNTPTAWQRDVDQTPLASPKAPTGTQGSFFPLIG